MGEYVGALKDISAIDLGAVAAPRRSKQPGSNLRKSITRLSATHCKLPAMRTLWRASRRTQAGVPFERPALTVNRLCGSGIQSIVSGAQMIQLGERKRVWSAAWNRCRRRHTSSAAHDRVSTRPGKTRRQLDGRVARYLLQHADGRHCGEPRSKIRDPRAKSRTSTHCDRSRKRRAKDAGFFAEEIVAVEVKSRKALLKSPMTTTRDRKPRSKFSQNSNLHLRKTDLSRRAMLQESSMVPRRS